MWSFSTRGSEKAHCYTSCQLRVAQHAHDMQDIMVYSTDTQLAKSTIHLANCPVTQGNVQTVFNIFVQNLGGLTGKLSYCSVPHVQSGNYLVPVGILHCCGSVTLTIDIMFINKIPLFVTMSWDLKVLTVGNLQNRQENSERQA
jgi:hypothetical protein